MFFYIKKGIPGKRMEGFFEAFWQGVLPIRYFRFVHLKAFEGEDKLNNYELVTKCKTISEKLIRRPDPA